VKTYLPFLKNLQYPEDTPNRKTYPRERPTPQTFDVVASDGYTTLLTRYKGKKGPVLLVSCLFLAEQKREKKKLLDSGVVRFLFFE